MLSGIVACTVRFTEQSPPEGNLFMNRVATMALIAFCPLALAQVPNNSARPSAKIVSPNISWEKFLAAPSEWRSYSARIVANSQVSITFRMTTSWIPGPDHKGTLRYKLTAAPDLFTTLKSPSLYPEVANQEKIESFVKRLGDYRMSIVFYDKDGFVDRKIPIDFAYGVDDSGSVSSLLANDAVEMGMDDYKGLLTQGSWIISWLDPIRGKN
jgi:hypothetical protein